MHIAGRAGGAAIVTGLRAEAECCRRAGLPLVRCDGPGFARAGSASANLASAGATGLVSFGVCGGLDPALRSGAVVLADGIVLHGGETLATDAAWRARVKALLGQLTPIEGRLASVDTVLATSAAKDALHRATNALAVDMESAAIGRVARDRGLPFLVVRVVADPADRAIPEAALAGMGRDGRIRPIKALAGMLVRPGQVASVMRLSRDSRVAFAMLDRIAQLAGPAFRLAGRG